MVICRHGQIIYYFEFIVTPQSMRNQQPSWRRQWLSARGSPIGWVHTSIFGFVEHYGIDSSSKRFWANINKSSLRLHFIDYLWLWTIHLTPFANIGKIEDPEMQSNFFAVVWTLYKVECNRNCPVIGHLVPCKCHSNNNLIKPLVCVVGNCAPTLAEMKSTLEYPHSRVSHYVWSL